MDNSSSSISSAPSLPEAPQLSSSKKGQDKRMKNAEIKSQYDLSKYQNDYNYWEWQQQNAYNTPAAQMQRFTDAGLNPNLVYGQGNNGNASSMHEAASPANGVSQAFSHQIQLQQLQLQKLNMVSDILQKGANTAATLNQLRSEVPQSSYMSNYYRGLDPKMASFVFNANNRLQIPKIENERDYESAKQLFGVDSKGNPVEFEIDSNGNRHAVPLDISRRDNPIDLNQLKAITQGVNDVASSSLATINASHQDELLNSKLRLQNANAVLFGANSRNADLTSSLIGANTENAEAANYSYKQIMNSNLPISVKIFLMKLLGTNIGVSKKF